MKTKRERMKEENPRTKSGWAFVGKICLQRNFTCGQTLTLEWIYVFKEWVYIKRKASWYKIKIKKIKIFLLKGHVFLDYQSALKK